MQDEKLVLPPGAMVEQEDEDGTTIPGLCRSSHCCGHCHGRGAHTAGQRQGNVKKLKTSVDENLSLSLQRDKT